jgi:hypothetical protein
VVEIFHRIFHETRLRSSGAIERTSAVALDIILSLVGRAHHSLRLSAAASAELRLVNRKELLSNSDGLEWL